MGASSSKGCQEQELPAKGASSKGCRERELQTARAPSSKGCQERELPGQEATLSNFGKDFHPVSPVKTFRQGLQPFVTRLGGPPQLPSQEATPPNFGKDFNPLSPGKDFSKDFATW